MKHELWYRIYEISGIAAVFFSLLTLFFIIRFRVFSLLRFLIGNRRTEQIPDAEAGKISPEQYTRTERIEKTPDISSIRKTGTVIAGTTAEKTGTVIAEDTFFITRNIVIKSIDASFIDSVQ